jgi:hypothetical protein
VSHPPPARGVVPPDTYAAEIASLLDAAVARIAAFVGPVQSVAVGWATVELDRAEADLRAARGGQRPTDAPEIEPAVEAPADELLGARCRLLSSSADPPLVLLEPATEGRLAASLARFGEGPIALYLRVPARVVARFRVVAPASGVHCSRPAAGPFGTAVLVLDGPPSGPHLVVTEAAPAGTIER